MIRALLIVAVLGALVVLITTQIMLANPVQLSGTDWYVIGPAT